MLGHASAAMTLDRYADLFDDDLDDDDLDDDDLDDVADRLDTLRAASRGRVADFCGPRPRRRARRSPRRR